MYLVFILFYVLCIAGCCWGGYMLGKSPTENELMDSETLFKFDEVKTIQTFGILDIVKSQCDNNTFSTVKWDKLFDLGDLIYEQYEIPPLKMKSAKKKSKKSKNKGKKK